MRSLDWCARNPAEPSPRRRLHGCCRTAAPHRLKCAFDAVLWSYAAPSSSALHAGSRSLLVKPSLTWLESQNG